MVGEKFSHYKIIEKLGEGGMGEVYKAQDLKLKRVVALKFLSGRAVGSAEDKARFEQEAQSAASLNHPNICTIHEIGEHRDLPYIAMEYVEGASLKDKIRAGAMPMDAAVDIALQIADGLGAAHANGIIHRDIKPANIMITSDGRAKIMDFGLAKGPSSADLTRAGTTVGTVAYMSPEQGRGETVDLRADIWSLGAVFYELLTGRQPFRGDHEQAVLYSIVNENPAPIVDLRPDVPAGIEGVVFKCLNKDPWQRFSDCGSFVDAVRRAADTAPLEQSRPEPVAGSADRTADRNRQTDAARGGGRSWKWPITLVLIVAVAAAVLILFPRFAGRSDRADTPQFTKIAVLFFQNLGPTSDEYFADGITDAITARLARIRRLGVISRQSTVKYKGSDKDIHTIGEELGADYILEGTIQRERPGDPTSRVRIIPQLIRVADDIHVWADTYDEDMTEVFHVQSQIAERVAAALDITLLEPEKRLVNVEPTQNLEAYEYYLRANELFYNDRYSAAASRQSIELFERAVELDGEYAAAWAGLSQARVWAYYATFEPSEQVRIAARTAVDRAMDLAPDMPESHMALGYYYYYADHDFQNALEHFFIADEKSPNNGDIIWSIALVTRRLGKWEESLDYLQRVRQLDIQNGIALWDVAVNLTYMRHYDEAELQLNRVIALGLVTTIPFEEIISIYLLRDGNADRAREAVRNIIAIKKSTGWSLELLLTTTWPSSYIRMLPTAFDGLLKRELTMPDNSTDTTAFYINVAQAYSQLGARTKATQYFEAAIQMIESRTHRLTQTNSFGASFGIAYAAMGRTEEAIAAAEAALEYMPISKDAVVGPVAALTAAEVFVLTGEHDRAIDLLETLLSVPALVSRPLLRADPLWDPLRDNPRFQKLVEEPQ